MIWMIHNIHDFIQSLSPSFGIHLYTKSVSAKSLEPRGGGSAEVGLVTRVRAIQTAKFAFWIASVLFGGYCGHSCALLQRRQRGQRRRTAHGQRLLLSGDVLPDVAHLLLHVLFALLIGRSEIIILIYRIRRNVYSFRYALQLPISTHPHFMLQPFLQDVWPLAQLNYGLDQALRVVPEIGHLWGSGRRVGRICGRVGGRRRLATCGRIQLLLAAVDVRVMVVVVQVRMLRQVLLRLVTGLVFAALQVPLHVLDLVQDFAVLLAQVRALRLQLAQILFACLVILKTVDSRNDK